MDHLKIVGRLYQPPWRFAERSGGDASDTNGQAGGQMSGSE